MTTTAPPTRDEALAEGRLAGHLIGLVFAIVVVAFLVGLFLL
jgi:tetrahydromethanopterin S-methyltransferase subunit F